MAASRNIDIDALLDCLSFRAAQDRLSLGQGHREGIGLAVIIPRFGHLRSCRGQSAGYAVSYLLDDSRHRELPMATTALMVDVFIVASVYVFLNRTRAYVGKLCIKSHLFDGARHSFG